MKMLKNIFVAGAVALTIAMAGCGDTAQNHDSLTSVQQTDAIRNEVVQKKQDSKVIVDNEYITAEFIEFRDEPSLGVFYTFIRITNKTDQDILAVLEDATVNDEMVFVMTGIPPHIMPGKKGTNGYIFSFSQVSISDFSEVQKVAFKIAIKDNEHLSDVYTSDEIILEK